jgi:DNA-binding IclR family transcriptional regulator
MTGMSNQSSTTVAATMNSFCILERLVESGRAMGVTELAGEVDLSKGVVHSHLTTLSELGYVKKSDSKYLPSFGLLALGERTRKRLRLYNVAVSHVENLARATEEVAVLFVEEDGVGICVHLACGSGSWSPDYICGERIPLNATAPGKAILSTLDQQHVDTIVDRGLPKLTSETISDVDSLSAELRNVRDNGIAFCRGEQFEGIIGVAAPIGLNERGPAAAVGVCGPGDRLTGRYLEEDITGQVISTAKSIQVDLTK